MTADPILPLASAFEPATEAQWRGLVDKALKGGDFERRLVSRTADAIPIQPLYTRAGTADPISAARGTPRQGDTWDIRQVIAEEDPAKANTVILDDLKGGATSVLLQIAAPGWSGLDYHAPSMARALDGVLLDVCPVALRAGEYTTDCAGSLLSLWRAAGLTPEQCAGAFNYDPLGTLALTGSLYQPLDKALAVAAELVRTTVPYPRVQALLADGHVWNRGGASDAQELAAIFASVVSYLRAAELAGLAPDVAMAKIAISVAVDADQFAGIAKLRAVRVGLARIAEASGAGGAVARIAVVAMTSERMLTRRDPWVNLLRNTIACSAAAMGGADVITVLPYTWAMGQSDGFARRIARNTHLVLQEESGLGRVHDPAGGSFYVESYTRDLAAKAWSMFQDIERQGGLGAMLTAGTWQAALAETSRQRSADLATGKLELTGTSAFPRLGDDGVTVTAWPPSMPADLPGARATPISVVRSAEPFERLRDAADAAATKPRVFLATLGPLAQHAARATWMRNFLAAGGIEAVGDTPLLTSTEAGRAFAESGCSIVCLCGADDTYAELAEASTSLLKTAGAHHVYLAGRQKNEALYRAAGVDGFIFAGIDMVAMLTNLQRELAVP